VLLQSELAVGFLALVVGIVVGQPLSTYLHELGHAVVALLATTERVTIHLGTNEVWSFRIGRLRTTVGTDGWQVTTGLPGEVRHAVPPESNWTAVSALAGPAVSLALTVGAALVASAVNGPIELLAIYLTYANGIQFLATAVPVVYPEWVGAYAGMASDGRRALNAIRN
jgi:hypothetical protein